MNDKIKKLVDKFTFLADCGILYECTVMEMLLDVLTEEELTELGYGDRVKAYMEG